MRLKIDSSEMLPTGEVTAAVRDGKLIVAGKGIDNRLGGTMAARDARVNRPVAVDLPHGAELPEGPLTVTITKRDDGDDIGYYAYWVIVK